jgi:hypothetical protein
VPLPNLPVRARIAALVALALACVAVLLLIPPIRQGPGYYDFPDSRVLLGVPAFWNVLSNLPFAIVGIIGLRATARQPAPLRAPWLALFAGIFLTAFGSGFYHLAPSASRLLFDRLPMTIAFASVFALALADRVDPRLGTRLLLPFLLIAAGSALYWYVFGDLRPYAFVQGYPMMAVPLLLLLARGRHLDGRMFAAAVGVYFAAKVLERFDGRIYDALGHVISGHALKHLVAAVACWCLYRMRPTSPS